MEITVDASKEENYVGAGAGRMDDKMHVSFPIGYGKVWDSCGLADYSPQEVNIMNLELYAIAVAVKICKRNTSLRVWSDN